MTTSNSKSEDVKELKLKPWQPSHVKNILKGLCEDCYVGVGDTSIAGAGKTFVWAWVAKELGYKVLVVCPNSLKTSWKRHCLWIGVEWVDVINYERLGGRDKSGCGHEWLLRKNDIYTPTKKYLSLLKEGILLIFDEVHYVKRKESYQSMAAFALTAAVVGTASRIGFLSNTPFDKQKHAGAIMRILGVIRTKKMYEYDYGSKRYIFAGHGLAQLIGYCRKLNPERTTYLRTIYPLRDKTNIEMLPYQLYTQIVKKNLVYSMDYDPSDRITPHNCFYHMNPEDVNKIDTGYSKVKAISTDGKSNLNRFSALTEGQGLVEAGKINKLIAFTTKSLKENQDRKLIIYVNRIVSMNTLRQALKKYGAIVVNSGVKGDDRDEAFAKFQADSNENRVLIASAKLGGTGLNLGDLTGRHPREIYILPSYSYINDYQGSRRATRADSIGHTNVYYMYCGNSKLYVNEKVLLNQLKKSKVHIKVVNKEKDICATEKYVTWYENEADRP